MLPYTPRSEPLALEHLARAAVQADNLGREFASLRLELERVIEVTAIHGGSTNGENATNNTVTLLACRRGDGKRPGSRHRGNLVDRERKA